MNQSRRGHLESLRQLVNDEDGRVSSPPLNPADVRPVQPCQFGQGLLGEVPSGAQFAKISGKGLARIHARKYWQWATISLQTISHINVNEPSYKTA